MIMSILNELSSDNSRLAKEAIMKREKDNVLLQRVIKATYDPTINFWIKKIPAYSRGYETMSLSDALNSLSFITTRKVTGNAALVHLTTLLSALDPEDAEVLERIIDRDLACGIQTTTVNKIWKKLIPEFSYMRCALPTAVDLTKWDWKNGIYSQLKADSMFCNIDVYDGDVVITTRNGTVIPNDKIQNIASVAVQFLSKNTRTHGELMVEEAGKILPREIGNGILSSISKGGDFKNNAQRAVYFGWDQIPLQNALEGTEYKKTYSSRLNILRTQLANLGIQNDIQVIPSKIVKSYEEALEHYQEQLEAGLEGTIIKTQTGFWKDGTSKEQVKLKLDCVVELEMVELTEGKGKNVDTFGSIMCKSSDGLLEVNVSGFTDQQREEIFADWQNIKGKIMAVCFNNIMSPTGKKTTYSLFLPRCVEIRDDKDIADSSKDIK